MRVKVKAKQYGIEQFEFGKTYYFAYAGITMGDVCTFTRKNRLEMCDIDGETGKKKSSHWVSKRKLKKLLRIGLYHFISEVEVENKKTENEKA